MSPLGKLTFALIGLRFWGADGLFCGLFLGHMLIDKTYVIRRIEQQINRADDYIRVKLPYKYYRFYNQMDGNVWGKLWGLVLGLVLFGFLGMILLPIAGHFIFDMPNNADIRRAKKKTDHFFDNNWGKILGLLVGFVLNSPILMIIGLVLGFIADYQRLEGAKLIPFDALRGYWQKINPLKLWRHAQGGEHRQYLEVMAALAALTAEADGKISAKEKQAFKQIFAVKDDSTSPVSAIFNNKKKHQAGLEKYADILEELTRDNDDLKESSLENLFKIAAAEETIQKAQADILKHVADVINLDEKVFARLTEQFTPKPIDKKLAAAYDLLGVSHDANLKEIKAKWKSLIMIYHPDNLGEASEKEIKLADKKMTEINLAYQKIVKAKGKK